MQEGSGEEAVLGHQHGHERRCGRMGNTRWGAIRTWQTHRLRVFQHAGVRLRAL